MAKYLKRYGSKITLDAVQASTTGQPWVGSETMTNSVRYEPKGIVEPVDGEEVLPEAPGAPEIGDGEKEMQ
jgi:hypothetical protein